MKKLLLRLDDDLAARLETIARVDRMPIADEVREAIAAHVDARRADPEFQRRLHLAMERDRQSYESLFGPSPVISLAEWNAHRPVPGAGRHMEPEAATGLLDAGEVEMS